MPPLESADRHPAPSQKLPASKEPTPPAATASAHLLSSSSIVPSPLSLNLLSYTPPHTLQTGDSNLVTNTTIDRSRKYKVPQQQDQDIVSVAQRQIWWSKSHSRRLFHLVTGKSVLKLKSSARAGGFVWKYSPLSACCNGNLFRHASTTTAAVIPCKGTLDDSTSSRLPVSIDDSGQPLFSLEATSPHTGQVPIKEDGEEAVLAGQNTGSLAVNGDGILPTPVSPGLTPSCSFPPFRRSDPHPFFTSTRFDDGILPTPHFSILLPSPSSRNRSGSIPTHSGPPQLDSSTPVSHSSHSTLGAHPLSFSPLPSTQFSPSFPHPSPVLASLPIPFPPPPIPACAFCFTSLSSSSPSSSRTMLCAMSINRHRLSLCVFV